MLRDENGHRDKDSKHEEQGGCPDAAPTRGKVPRAVAIRQFGRRSGATAGRRSREEAHLAGVSGSVLAGPRKAAVMSDRAGAAEGCRAARACRVVERAALGLVQASSIPPSMASALGTRGWARFAPAA